MLLLTLAFVHGAPASWALALNHETHECGSYWAGDKFSYYDLPAGWESYYFESVYTFDTPYGSCIVKESDPVSLCCEQLNLTAINISDLNYNKEVDCINPNDGKEYIYT